ncbi:unnamed protein product [Pleuronectes platessa]|uniref:Uncharacterized protein n=1 Tax=Pleuronectes platessa TaxID=8262 RepID=A0A9N7VF53_PLEPL|nr:unnamed protein product [Pleuronectes platessa]
MSALPPPERHAPSSKKLRTALIHRGFNPTRPGKVWCGVRRTDFRFKSSKSLRHYSAEGALHSHQGIPSA